KGRKDFWNDQTKAAKISQEVSGLKVELQTIEAIEKELKDLEELAGLSEGGEDLEKLYHQLAKTLDKEELRIYLSGKYDKKHSLLEIFAGAGGQDAEDWATMLLRMYIRYCEKRGFKTQILHQSFGDPGPEGRIGTKSVTLEVKGNYAYGFLKKEGGVHRLVRLSPFNSQDLRHTSFALVEMLPEIDQDDSEIEIKPEDIRLETFKSSGPGGQYVNKTESAVRIIHLPTGITVSCQTERMQGKNREHAMKILYSKLSQLKKDEYQKELKSIKGGQVSASWGNQIRSYVLHPYQMVKDLRTEVETSDTQGVLDGDLEEFINAEVKFND
ncbi:peptide chain release factor 2, partial [Candidatus Parcubacteria bacterium]|nr:peptide chain release factor 2 [Candidatus Parcubacteria bacterium]